ncbi:MAG: hypothetical protein RL538_599 [Candidatus Parcubacteria bacterium]|jgi:hypothetical protein
MLLGLIIVATAIGIYFFMKSRKNRSAGSTPAITGRLGAVMSSSKVWMLLGAALVALGIWYAYTNDYVSSSYATQALELAKEHWWVLLIAALLVMYLLPKTSGTAVKIARFGMWAAIGGFILAFAYPSLKKEAICSNHLEPAQLYVVYNLEEGCDHYFDVTRLPQGFGQDGVGPEFATRPLAELVYNNRGIMNGRLKLTTKPEVMRAEYRHHLPIVFLPPGVKSSAEVADRIVGYPNTSTTPPKEPVEEKVVPKAAPRPEAEYDI